LESLVGTTLDGQYQIEALLGRGGMGTVYRARHILLGDQVAVKILPPHMTADSAALRRFLREGQAARRFRHPNVVTVHDLRNSGSTVYMVLEYVQGRTLAAELRAHGSFSPSEAVRLITPIAEALDAAHAVGVVHRDLKPDNIMVGESDGVRTIKLLDLGIAKVRDTSATALTGSGQILGTPYYMSPEQWGAGSRDGDDQIDGRADVYSLAVVIFELVTGCVPFGGSSIQEIASKHLLSPPPLLHEVRPGTPAAFSAAIARAMSKDRSSRHSRCGELLAELLQAITAELNAPTERRIHTLATIVQSGFDPLATKQIDCSFDPNATLVSQASTAPTEIEFTVVTVDSTGSVINSDICSRAVYCEKLPGAVIELVEIPAGSFWMGSPETEAKRLAEESPQHLVTLSRFLMARTPVTQAQWRAVATLAAVHRELKAAPSKFKGDNLPVENVSFEDCEEFCARLSAYTGKRYSLPTEAQWEYGCRAGTDTPFHLGASITTDLVNYNGIFRYLDAPRGVNRGQTTPVGSFPANYFGLSDMHGNVWEWCLDTWHNHYNGAPTDGSAWMDAGDASRRVIRGGSWYSNSALCRSAARTASVSNACSDWLGLRVVVLN
ncbi:MAG: bifunctional serine/threonine-protein kinase/formylglycine-generating enzyme family protein, partial [Candidatus Bathyarchaeia archaeon]